MKALVYQGAKTLEYTDVADPTPKHGEALIRVDSVGICGSDMHAYLGHDERRPAPLILGHEVAGTVIGGDWDGKRVTVNPLVTCGSCEYCTQGRDNLCTTRQIISMPPREGGFAELLAMPMQNLVEVPADVPLEKAALAEPIACGWHASEVAKRNVQKPFVECSALVIGGGAIGVGAALSLKAHGITELTLIEPSEARRNMISDTTNIAVASEADGTYDVVIDAVGIAPTRAIASERVKPGGVIVHIGLGSAKDGLDIRRMTLQEIAFIGTYTYTMQDFKATAEAIFDGRLGSLDWIDCRPLSAGAQAFSELLGGQVASPKIILKPATLGDSNG
ncbi:MAG: alcohol dehydrogenase catalytic domain-containing protein [Gammaproteobacteria bacterium]|nr:alcohol dehydrogenase catalytic domain-containing protein [Gammaproteobacteria bacterium]